MAKRPATERQAGRIKRIVRDRGFGFIASDQGMEFFFHRSALAQGVFDTLVEGERVTFDAAQGDKGPRAANVLVNRTDGPRG
jgi:CspA family cold shock protein